MMTFIRADFQCPCDNCTSRPTIDYELVRVIEDLAEWFSKPVRVHSGYRCRDRNRFIGGSAGSMHMTGKAADVSVEGVTPSKVATCLEDKYPGKYGIGRYHSHTHIDVRANAARWNTTE